MKALLNTSSPHLSSPALPWASLSHPPSPVENHTHCRQSYYPVGKSNRNGTRTKLPTGPCAPPVFWSSRLQRDACALDTATRRSRRPDSDKCSTYHRYHTLSMPYRPLRLTTFGTGYEGVYTVSSTGFPDASPIPGPAAAKLPPPVLPTELPPQAFLTSAMLLDFIDSM